MRLPAKQLDKARRYWLLQVSITYGIATFLFAMAIFHSSLPTDRWEKFFSPLLLSPSIASVAVMYRILVNHKKAYEDNEIVTSYYIGGMILCGVGLIVAVLAQIA